MADHFGLEPGMLWVRVPPELLMNKLQAKTLRIRRRAIESLKKVAEGNLKSRLEALRAELVRLQGRCPHENVIWFCDPAGDSSEYECSDCQKNSKVKFGKGKT